MVKLWRDEEKQGKKSLGLLKKERGSHEVRDLAGRACWLVGEVCIL